MTKADQSAGETSRLASETKFGGGKTSSLVVFGVTVKVCSIFGSCSALLGVAGSLVLRYSAADRLGLSAGRFCGESFRRT